MRTLGFDDQVYPKNYATSLLHFTSHTKSLLLSVFSTVSSHADWTWLESLGLTAHAECWLLTADCRNLPHWIADTLLKGIRCSGNVFSFLGNTLILSLAIDCSGKNAEPLRGNGHLCYFPTFRQCLLTVAQQWSLTCRCLAMDVTESGF
jgi:hypothetical protein